MIFIDEHVQYEELYRNIIGQMELMHKDNLKRLKIGFRCILVVPTIFLLLLLFTKSSKVVFLILWIVSMFIIAAYLIGIEYSDYKLQARINNAAYNEGAQTTTLMAESIEENKNAMHDLLMREESRLPFKFGAEHKDEEMDAAEYDTGDDEDFSPEAPAADFDDYDSDYDAGGLTADVYDTLPEESGEVLSAEPVSAEALSYTDEAEPYESVEAGTDELHFIDIDDDMDDLETLLTPDDIGLSDVSDIQHDAPANTPEDAESPVEQSDDDSSDDSIEPASGLESNLLLDDILSEYHGDFFAPDELNGDAENGDSQQTSEFEESSL